MDSGGLEVSPPTKIENSGPAKEQTLAFDGRETHVVWKERGHTLSIRLNGGDPERKVLSDHGIQPHAGPWGSAVWVDAGRLFFWCDGMIPDTGGRVDPVSVAAGGVAYPQVAFNGMYFAVVWSASTPGGRDIMLQRVSPEGELLGDPMKVSFVPGVARGATIVWDGVNFAVAWTQQVDKADNPKDRHQIYFAVVPQVGSQPLVTSTLPFKGSMERVALAPTGTAFGLSWVGSLGEAGSAIYFQLIGSDGKPVGRRVKASDGVPLSCSKPALAWDGKGFAAVWHDDRAHVDSEVFFAYLKCGEPAPGEAAETDQGGQQPGGEDGQPADDGGPKLKEVF
jgi:hypothetical protein